MVAEILNITNVYGRTAGWVVAEDMWWVVAENMWWVVWGVGGGGLSRKKCHFRGQSCKLRFSARLNFKDGPRVAIKLKLLQFF